MNTPASTIPQTVQVQFPERPKPVMQKLRLAGRSSTKLPFADSIGYFGGEIPHVYIRIRAKWYKVVQGQIIPTSNAHDLVIFNPFQTTAEVDVIKNIEVGSRLATHSNDVTEHRDKVTYRSQIVNPAGEDDKDRKGLGFMITKGALRVTLDRSSYYQIMILPDVQADFLDFKPSGFMTKEFDIRHDEGAIFDGFIGISGGYNHTEITQWVTDTNYDMNKAIYPTEDTATVSIGLTPNMAVFCVTENHGKLRVDFEGRDLGVLDDATNG